MGLSYLEGEGFWHPEQWPAQPTPVFNSLGTIDATGEKLAICGFVWWPGDKSGTKAIRRLVVGFGTVVKAGGSALTLSLQNISTTNPIQPDETQDQTVAIANADAGFASDVQYRSGALSADRTVSAGDFIAAVLEFDGGGRLGADSVQLRGFTVSNQDMNNQGAATLKTAAWVGVIARRPILILEFSDGTFGKLEGSYPYSNLAVAAISNATTPDEVAMKFTPAVTSVVDAVSVLFDPVNAARDCEIILYEGTSALVTLSVDASQLAGVAAATHIWRPIAETTLTAGTAYYLAIKPTTASTFNVPYAEVSDANHWTTLPGGTAYHWAERTDAGAWSATTTRRPMMSLRRSKIHDGTGGGGGGLKPVGSGGLVG